MIIPVQRFLGPLSYIVKLLHLSAVLVSITTIMFIPRTKAEPAELMLTGRTAAHVHAPKVLLNGSPALGTWLGFRKYPCHVLCFRTVLQNPLRHSRTIHRPMSILQTVPAKTSRAKAANIIPSSTFTGKLHGILAIRRWTPLGPLVALDIRPHEVT